ncbi:MAG: hypothetical protein AAF593_01100 [Planctomycetota bacterium]
MRPTRSGYILLEMVATLSLLTVFLIVGGQLVTRVVVVQRDAVDMEWSVSRMEFALRQLRQDVWTASDISVVANADTAGRIELTHPDGVRIAWWFEAEPSRRFPGRGWMRRAVLDDEESISHDHSTTRYEVPFGVTPAATQGDTGLLIQIDERSLWLPSQVRLAQTETVDAAGRQP